MLTQAQHLAGKDAQDSLITTLIQKGTLLADKSWPNKQWNSQTKQLENSNLPSTSMAEMVRKIEGLIECVTNEGAIQRFTSIKSDPNLTTVPWKLEIRPMGTSPDHEIELGLAGGGHLTEATQSGRGRGKGRGKPKALLPLKLRPREVGG